MDSLTPQLHASGVALQEESFSAECFPFPARHTYPKIAHICHQSHETKKDTVSSMPIENSTESRFIARIGVIKKLPALTDGYQPQKLTALDQGMPDYGAEVFDTICYSHSVE